LLAFCPSCGIRSDQTILKQFITQARNKNLHQKTPTSLRPGSNHIVESFIVSPLSQRTLMLRLQKTVYCLRAAHGIQIGLVVEVTIQYSFNTSSSTSWFSCGFTCTYCTSTWK
jgi:hypothetical protein